MTPVPTLYSLSLAKVFEQCCTAQPPELSVLPEETVLQLLSGGWGLCRDSRGHAWFRLSGPRLARVELNPPQQPKKTGVLAAGRLTPRLLACFQATGHELVQQRIKVGSRDDTTGFAAGGGRVAHGAPRARRARRSPIGRRGRRRHAGGPHPLQPAACAPFLAPFTQELNVQELPPVLPDTRNPWLGDELRRW
jgi:hypothetical protein